MTRFSFVLFALISLLLTACQDKQKVVSNTENGTSVPLSYAQGFGITHSSGYTTITVYNPWKPGEIYDTYYLVKNEGQAVPTDGLKVVIPLKSIMTNSATHLGFLELLGELDKVTGVCNSNYIYNPTILQGVKDGTIKDLGDAFNLDIENLLLLHPQAVMTSAYNAEDENSRRMKQTGLPILYNIEWQEKSILGRAEWIKFIGAFFDKEKLADSIFSQIAEQYNEIKKKAEKLSYAPSILSGQDYRELGPCQVEEATMRNSFAMQVPTTIMPMTPQFPEVYPVVSKKLLIHFNQADIWVGVQANTLEDLGKMDPKYKLFKSYKNGNVYHINKRTNITGGNDYWESGVARPDLLLNDMIKIIHPSLLPEYELTYMDKLKSK